MIHAFRLKKGMLLREEIQNYCIKHNIEAGVISSCVGSLSKVFIRNDAVKVTYEINGDLEIIAMNGNVSKNRVHIHISVAEDDLKLFGGHLKNESVVNTTAEIIITEIPNMEFVDEYDSDTGYNELQIIRK